MVIEKAEARLAELPTAVDEHRRAQAVLGDLDTFVQLAQASAEDRALQRFARRAEDLRRSIAAPPVLFANGEALRALIERVRGADLEDLNGPVRNPNVAEAWRRRFQELVSWVPGVGHAEGARRRCVRCSRRRVRRGRGGHDPARHARGHPRLD